MRFNRLSVILRFRRLQNDYAENTQSHTGRYDSRWRVGDGNVGISQLTITPSLQGSSRAPYNVRSPVSCRKRKTIIINRTTVAVVTVVVVIRNYFAEVDRSQTHSYFDRVRTAVSTRAERRFVRYYRLFSGISMRSSLTSGIRRYFTRPHRTQYL